MVWELLSIREPGAMGEEHDDADSVLYPVPNGTTNGIKLDDTDGNCAPPVTATTIELLELAANGKKNDTLLKAEGIKASIYITDSRIAVACTNYDKGGGWGEDLTGIALNAVSKVRAAVRRRGTILVGHIRYPWLRSSGYIEKTGWLSDEQLRFVATAKNKSEHTYLLDMTLPKSTSAENIAREVTRRAARYRLAHTRMESEEERAAVEDLLEPPGLEHDKGRFATWRFPTYFFVRGSTAFGDVGTRPN